MKTKKSFKKSSVACAFLLASSQAWSKEGTGQAPNADEQASPPPAPPSQEEQVPKPPKLPGKTDDGQLKPGGDKDVTPRKGNRKIDEIKIVSVQPDTSSDRRKLKTCSVPRVAMKPLDARDVLSLSFNPKQNQVATLKFIMSDLPEEDEQEYKLVLLHSSCLAEKPQLKTRRSKNKLLLNANRMAILGTYPVEERTTGPMTFYIDLETDKLVQNVDAGNDTFYFQAGLLKKTDFEKGRCTNMILSQVRAIHVTSKSCPNRTQFSARFKENSSCQGLPTKAKQGAICQAITQ
jgi:hypothetical protein